MADDQKAIPYKRGHDRLLAAIGVPDQYHDNWRPIAGMMRRLVTPLGFDPRGVLAPAAIRARLNGVQSESDVLTAAATGSPDLFRLSILNFSKVDFSLQSFFQPIDEQRAINRRALALKTIRHLYHRRAFGKQHVWILSLPKPLRAYPMEYEDSPSGIVRQVLDADDEQFDALARNNLGHACQMALAWVERAMMVAGEPALAANRALFGRWFVPAGMKDADTKILAFAKRMTPILLKMANALKSGTIIILDSPHERRTNSKLENSNAFVFTRHDITAIFVEKGFFRNKTILSNKYNCAKTIIHELSHIFGFTKDHSYSWQGLLPRDGDTFKSANDRNVAWDPKWPAVRCLTFEQCTNNADSWAFFVADCAGKLSVQDRIEALGNLHQTRSGIEMDEATKQSLQERAG